MCDNQRIFYASAFIARLLGIQSSPRHILIPNFQVFIMKYWLILSILLIFGAVSIKYVDSCCSKPDPTPKPTQKPTTKPMEPIVEQPCGTDIPGNGPILVGLV